MSSNQKVPRGECSLALCLESKTSFFSIKRPSLPALVLSNTTLSLTVTEQIRERDKNGAKIPNFAGNLAGDSLTGFTRRAPLLISDSRRTRLPRRSPQKHHVLRRPTLRQASSRPTPPMAPRLSIARRFLRRRESTLSPPLFSGDISPL